MDYADKDKIKLIVEIEKALSSIRYGSVELYVQNNIVTQITVRKIQKTSVEFGDDSEEIRSQLKIDKVG